MELMESYIKNGEKKRAKRLLVVMWNVCRGNREPRPDLRNYRHCWIEPEIKDVLASVHHRLLPSLATALQTSAAEFFQQSGEDEPCLTTGFADYHSVTSTSNKQTHSSVPSALIKVCCAQHTQQSTLNRRQLAV